MSVIKNLTILAPGLIGASVARAARQHRAAECVTLWSRRQETRDALRAQPWCDAVADTPESAVANADLVVLAAPVERIIELAAQIAPRLSPHTIVTDVGSVKSDLCRRAGAHFPQSGPFFIGSHPMAGSALTGWENSSATLFEKHICFITPPETAPAEIVRTVSDFWSTLGARVVPVDPALHDRIVAHVSHLPQAVATSLGSFLSGQPGEWRALAGNGLRDTTRIAASDATMWIEIFQQNHAEVLKAFDAYLAEAGALRDDIRSGNWESVRRRLLAGKAWRDGFDA